MAEYAYNTLGVKNIVMWTDNAMDYTKGLSKYFQDRFTQLGGKVLLNDVYMTEDKDFSALVSRLKANPDAQALFASSGPDTAGIIIKQVREAGIKLPILALALLAIAGSGGGVHADPAPVKGVAPAAGSIDAARMQAAAAARIRADGESTSPGYQEPVRSAARASAKSPAPPLQFKSLSDLAAGK